MRATVLGLLVLVGCGDDGERGVAQPATCEGFVRTWCEQVFACPNSCDPTYGCLVQLGQWHFAEASGEWMVVDVTTQTIDDCVARITGGRVVLRGPDPATTLTCDDEVDYGACRARVDDLTCEPMSRFVDDSNPWGVLLEQCMPGPVEHQNSFD